MLQRILKELAIDIYWLRRNAVRKWKLDTPFGILGIIAFISGMSLLLIIGEGFSKFFRNLIPYVAGSRVGEFYWSSLFLGLKFSFVFLVFVTTLIIFLVLKYMNRR